MAEEKVPDGLARLWRLGNPARLGRPAELDVERVVRAAVVVADQAGLGSVTLPKVAAALGVTKMALYRHVGSKDELFELMSDHAIGSPPEFAAAPGWRAGVRSWAYALRAVYAAHPWLPLLPITGPPRGPNTIAWMDAQLRVLRETGLDWATKVGIMMLVSGHVRQSSVLSQQIAQGRAGTGLDEAQVNQRYATALAALVEPEHFPDAAELFAAPLFRSPPDRGPGEAGEDDFDFALELILNGIAVEIAELDVAGG